MVSKLLIIQMFTDRLSVLIDTNERIKIIRLKNYSPILEKIRQENYS